MRRLYLLVGRALASQGALRRPDEIFFLTDDEVRRAVAGGAISGGIAAADIVFSLNWYSGYIVSAPPKTAATGIL